MKISSRAAARPEPAKRQTALEGKDYVVQDGDVLLFRFKLSTGKTAEDK